MVLPDVVEVTVRSRVGKIGGVQGKGGVEKRGYHYAGDQDNSYLMGCAMSRESGQ